MSGDLPDWTGRQAVGPEPMDTLTLAAGATQVTAQLTPPSNCSGLMIMLAPIGYPGEIFLLGAVTGYEYLPSVTIGANVGGPVPVAIPADGDAPYTLTLDYPTRPGTAPAQVAAVVYAMMGGGFSQVVGSVFSPLPIRGLLAQAAPGAVQVDTLSIGQEAADWDTGVGGFPTASIDQVVGGLVALMQNPAAAPSFDLVVGGNQGAGAKSVQTVRLPPQSVAAIAAAVSGTSVYTLIPAVAGQSIRLRGATLNFSATGAGSGTLKGGAVSVATIAPVTAAALPFCWEGLTLPVNTPLTFATAGIASCSLLGSITFDQY